MTFLEDVVDPLFKLTRSLYTGIQAAGKDKPSEVDADKWFELAKKASMMVRKTPVCRHASPFTRLGVC